MIHINKSCNKSCLVALSLFALALGPIGCRDQILKSDFDVEDQDIDSLTDDSDGPKAGLGTQVGNGISAVKIFVNGRPMSSEDITAIGEFDLVVCEVELIEELMEGFRLQTSFEIQTPQRTSLVIEGNEIQGFDLLNLIEPGRSGGAYSLSCRAEIFDQNVGVYEGNSDSYFFELGVSGAGSPITPTRISPANPQSAF